jgi:predicted nucleic acid-binding Zn ribbon protein
MRPDPDRVRLAAETLARARADAWARGERPGSSERSGVTDSGTLSASWSARPRREDPQSLNAALGGLLSARGWRQRAAVGAVFGGWAEIVGPQLAAHTRPESFDEGELVVAADSPAWATQVRLLAPQLLKRLAEELGAGTVRRVRVRGPSGSSGPQTAARRRRHVRLTQPQESVTTAKMGCTGSGRCPKEDGVSLVVRCAVDHRPRGSRGGP